MKFHWKGSVIYRFSRSASQYPSANHGGQHFWRLWATFQKLPSYAHVCVHAFFFFYSINLSFLQRCDFSKNIICGCLPVNGEFIWWYIFIIFNVILVKLNFGSNSMTVVDSRFDSVIFYNFLFHLRFAFILLKYVLLRFPFVCCDCFSKTVLFLEIKSRNVEFNYHCHNIILLTVKCFELFCVWLC